MTVKEKNGDVGPDAPRHLTSQVGHTDTLIARSFSGLAVRAGPGEAVLLRRSVRRQISRGK